MEKADDQRFIAAVLAGDVNAYGVLVERYQKPIFNLMYRMTGSHADALDLAQEAFIKCYEQLHRFQQQRKFYPWLYTIALNHARNFLRKKMTSKTSPLGDQEIGSGLDYPRQQEDFLCSKLDAKRLAKAMQDLPWDYREAVVLRYHEDFSMEDIAAALQLSVSGAKMRVHRGLKRLRDILMKGDHEAHKTPSKIA